jgi:hypothetical protein
MKIKAGQYYRKKWGEWDLYIFKVISIEKDIINMIFFYERDMSTSPHDSYIWSIGEFKRDFEPYKLTDLDKLRMIK